MDNIFNFIPILWLLKHMCNIIVYIVHCIITGQWEGVATSYNTLRVPYTRGVNVRFQHFPKSKAASIFLDLLFCKSGWSNKNIWIVVILFLSKNNKYHSKKLNYYSRGKILLEDKTLYTSARFYEIHCTYVRVNIMLFLYNVLFTSGTEQLLYTSGLS